MGTIGRKNSGPLIFIMCCIVGIIAGLVFTWSLYVKPLCSSHGWDTDSVAFIGNLSLACFSLGSTIGGQLLYKIGPKPTVFLGGIMFGGTLVLSSFIASQLAIGVLYGIVGGLGIGFIYVTGQFVAAAWFPKKKGLIIGIYLAIYGLSVTVFSEPIAHVIDKLGVHKAMVVIGLIMIIVVMFAGSFLRQPEFSETEKGEGAEAESPEYRRSYSVKGDEDKEPLAVLCRIFTTSLVICGYELLFYGFATEGKALTEAQAVVIVAATGIGSALGRVVAGALADKLGWKIVCVLMSAFSIISCVGLIFATGYVPVMVLMMLLSAGYGGRAAICGVYAIDSFGPKYSSGIFGIAMLGNVPVNFGSPLVTAHMRELSGGAFGSNFIVAIAISLVGLILVVLIPKSYVKR